MKRKEANLEIRNSGKVRIFTFPDFMSSKLLLHESALGKLFLHSCISCRFDFGGAPDSTRQKPRTRQPVPAPRPRATRRSRFASTVN